MPRPPNIRMTHGQITTPAASWFRVMYRSGVGPAAMGPEPAAIILGRSPLAPLARDVFTPEELEARIAHHAERVAREEPPGERVPRCDACGRLGRSTWNVGWWRRAVRGYGKSFVDTFCPDCFRRWGWGDGEGI